MRTKILTCLVFNFLSLQNYRCIQLKNSCTPFVKVGLLLHTSHLSLVS
jgi:hypothetical protein